MTDKYCLMAVHAHPDDEVFSTGGILAKYAVEGHRVVVVYCTNGEAGEMHDPDRDPEEALTLLGNIREEEAREACALLGVTDVYFLGYRDSGMVDTDENRNPGNFHNAPLQEASERLLAIMRETQPDVVVTYDEGGGYGHPDHVKCHFVSVEAFNRAQGAPWAPRKLYFSARSRESFPVYVEGLRRLDLQIPWLDNLEEFKFEEYGVPESEITASIDVSRYAALKKRALAVHRTQIPSDFFYLRIPDDEFPQLGGTEFFSRVQPAWDRGRHETDLFEGLIPREAKSSVANVAD